ncbi:hypothetical protein NTGHW29_560025 [Candidatus Nitrotoga sp. HW29]|nr:hypothetical protein NTGHW29_560025 [Candidatus Nitrotoga sp. HW29]
MQLFQSGVDNQKALLSSIRNFFFARPLAEIYTLGGYATYTGHRIRLLPNGRFQFRRICAQSSQLRQSN